MKLNEIKPGNLKVLSSESKQDLIVNNLKKEKNPGLVKWRSSTDKQKTCWINVLGRTWGFSLAGGIVTHQCCDGREWDQWGHRLTELCLEDLVPSLQMLSSTITGWENRIVPLPISWLIDSLCRNGRIEFSSKKNSMSRQKFRLQSTSFKIQAFSQMQQTNIQPPRNHSERTTKGNNGLKCGKHLSWGQGDLSK